MQEKKYQTLTAKAIDLLRHDILTSTFTPKQKLAIEALKQRYDMGATPIREALNQLTATGLVEAMGQRGFQVSSITPQELIDLFKVRELIEIEALKLSIERGDDVWESEVVARYHRLYKLETSKEFHQKPDLQEWLRRYRAFHTGLMKACGSKWLLKVQKMLFDQSERYRYLRLMTLTQIGDDLIKMSQDHEAMMQAVVGRKTREALRLLKTLYHNIIDGLLEEQQE